KTRRAIFKRTKRNIHYKNKKMKLLLPLALLCILANDCLVLSKPLTEHELNTVLSQDDRIASTKEGEMLEKRLFYSGNFGTMQINNAKLKKNMLAKFEELKKLIEGIKN
uniref:Uncharacterized protein n=1 Tax=Clytia hemisphaerica TaxID=252671 RepID=A0A7M5ULW2_9CNID